MERKDNYRIQMEQAQVRFLTYDQQALIEKMGLAWDETYLYITFFGSAYRLCRATGQLMRPDGTGAGYAETMTVLDILCDSREDRSLTGMWNGMQNFGLQFHSRMLEGGKNTFAETIQSNPQAFRSACRALGAEEIPGGDMGYAFEIMDGLKIGLLFWYENEDFSAQVRYYWDENALQYIRYETMHFAVGHLESLLLRAGML